MVDNFSDKQLIFLISQPRAGSTLLQRILGGHPAIHTTAETWLLLHPAYGLRETGHAADYNAPLAVEAVRDFCQTLPQGEEDYWEGVRRMAYYWYGTAVSQVNKPRFLDKTPRYYLIVPELRRLFPHAKFVILLRNPLAVLASVLNTQVKEHWPLLARYRHDLLEAPRLLAEARDALGAQGHWLQYEQLVAAPEREVARLCGYLGLEFRPEMVQYGQRQAPAGQMGDTTGIGQYDRPTAARLDRWLTLSQQPQPHHFLESYLQALGAPLVTRLGYDYDVLAAQLRQSPAAGQPVRVTWQSLFAPDERMRRRLMLLELALLEHRRLVYWLKGVLERR